MEWLMNLTKSKLLIACSNPRKLSAFYSYLIDSSVSEGIKEINYELRNEGGCQISFYKPSSNNDLNRIKPPSVALCFQKNPSLAPQSDLNNWVKEVISQGGKLIEGPILETFGAEAWMSDEEDNKFLLFIPFTPS